MNIKTILTNFVIFLDQENIDVSIDDEDQALLLLLCALPCSHAYFKEIVLYGRNSLIFEEVQSSLYSKDLNKEKEHKPASVGEGLFIGRIYSLSDSQCLNLLSNPNATRLIGLFIIRVALKLRSHAFLSSVDVAQRIKHIPFLISYYMYYVGTHCMQEITHLTPGLLCRVAPSQP